jgi:hypothetical protein
MIGKTEIIEKTLLIGKYGTTTHSGWEQTPIDYNINVDNENRGTECSYEKDKTFYTVFLLKTGFIFSFNSAI